MIIFMWDLELYNFAVKFMFYNEFSNAVNILVYWSTCVEFMLSAANIVGTVLMIMCVFIDFLENKWLWVKL